jgi:gliding motility-associated protein GldE
VPHYIEEIITIAIDIFFILLFVDVIPITFAQSNKIRVATFMALPLSILVKLFYPLSYFMVNASAFIEKKIRRYTDIDTNEIEQAIEMTADKNTTQEDIKVLKGIVHFGEITARQIMKPRMDIYALDYSWDFEKLIEYVREGGYSRLPVYIDSLDNIKGVLHVKDLLQHIDKDASFDWHSIIHEALYIPEGKKIDDLLKEIQSTRKHLAIVVDEHGGTCGIITLEDIVEEVLGEIKDEFDDDEEFTSNKVNDNTYIFEGKVLINDVCKIINADVNEFEEVRGEADSIAGLILEIAGKMPQKNEVFSFENYSFRVLNIEKNRIRRIEIKILDKE